MLCRTIGSCLSSRFVMFNKCQEDNGGENDVRRRRGEKASAAGIVFEATQRVMTYSVTKQRHGDIPHVDRAPYSPQCSGGFWGGGFVRSSFQSCARHSLKSSLPAVCRGCDHIHSGASRVRFPRRLRLREEGACASHCGDEKRK